MVQKITFTLLFNILTEVSVLTLKYKVHSNFKQYPVYTNITLSLSQFKQGKDEAFHFLQTARPNACSLWTYYAPAML